MCLWMDIFFICSGWFDFFHIFRMVWGDECLCWQQRKGIPKVLQIFQLFLANSDPPFYTHPKVPGLKGFFWWYIVEQPPVISHSKVLLLKTQMWPDRCLVTVEISVCILINNGLENLNWRSKCKTIISESNACRLGYWWLLYTFLWWQMPSKTCAEHVVEGSV